MGRPNKPSGFSDKLIENYGSADYFMGFETDNDGSLNRKYPLEKVADYTLKHREMTIGNETKTVGGFITSANNRVKQTENTVAALSSSMSSQSTQLANLNSKVRSNEGNIGELQIDLANNVAALTQMNNKINAIESGPLVAETASQMTNTSKVYVYVGNEENYTNGDWYYYNGRAWVSGGAYNAQGLNLDTTLTVEGLAPDSKAAGDAILELDERKANIDGAYEQMTVGNAEQLVGSAFNVDSVPYNFRTAGGSTDIGDREFNTIVGATVGWNQLIGLNFLRAPLTNNGVTFTPVENGGVKISGTVSGYTAASARIDENTNVKVVGHKYFVTPNAKNSNINIWYNGSGGFISNRDRIVTITSLASGFYMRVNSEGTEVDETVYPMVIDLTTIFGPTIADYIYSLEQATAGAGVAFFRKLFPKDYYPYSEPTLMSAKPTSHDTVGFNAWDEEWEVGDINRTTGENAYATTQIRSKNYIRVQPSTSYFIRCSTSGDSNLAICYYDSDKKFISAQWGINVIRVTPPNCHYIRFTSNNNYYGVYKNDICINLSWSGYRDGEYEPYKKHSYPLGGEELRGILKLDSANNLYADGDRYTPDGVITRRWKKIVIDGSGLWNDLTANYHCYTRSAEIPDIVTDRPTTLLLNSYGIVVKRTSASYKSLQFGDANNPIENIYPTLADFKAALDARPIEILYELAEPTTETSVPYSEVQIVDDFGTEEYVDTREIPIPVGHETKYPANLRDKLQHLPDLADSDGYYMIQQTSNDMSLIRFRIPQAPQEDGTYTLKATVSGGTPTYFWEEVTEE